MKKLLCFTTSLAAAVCAVGLGGAVAFADTENAAEAVNPQFYPSSFELVPSFDNLEDYAVGDGKILFLENNKISEYGDERVTTYVSNGKTLQSLYFEDGEFYYQTDEDDGKIYALKNFYETNNQEIENFDSTTKTDNITINNYHYYFNSSTNVLKVTDQSTDVIESLDGFTNLKLYGETVYAVKDNVLYTLNGTQSEKVEVENFEITKEIQVGDAFKGLTASAEQAPQFVRLTNGAYMTGVNLNKLTESSEYFIADDEADEDSYVGKTVQVNVSEMPTALLLYTAGDNEAGISVIAVNGKTYLIHPKDTTAKTVYPFKDSEFTGGTATEGYIYSSPYESIGTRVINLPYSAHVEILKEIRMAYNPELDGDFYYVRYEVDEETAVQGYVRCGLITTYDFNEAPPEETPDPDYTTEDLVKPVVLILIVLLLIAIAAGYIIYVGTSDKRKKKNSSVNTDANQQNKD